MDGTSPVPFLYLHSPTFLSQDQLLADFPIERLAKLEVYTFASAANHFSAPAIGKREAPFARVEHFANENDFVARIGTSILTIRLYSFTDTGTSGVNRCVGIQQPPFNRLSRLRARPRSESPGSVRRSRFPANEAYRSLVAQSLVRPLSLPTYPLFAHFCSALAQLARRRFNSRRPLCQEAQQVGQVYERRCSARVNFVVRKI